MQFPDQSDPRTPKQDGEVKQTGSGAKDVPSLECEEQPTAAETFDEEGAGIAAKE